MNSVRASRYRRLALAQQDKAIVDLLLKLADECDRGFFARLNGVQRGHPAKMTICQQEAPSLGLTGSGLNNESARPKPRAVFYDCNIVGVPRYRLSLLACVRPCLLQALFHSLCASRHLPLPSDCKACNPYRLSWRECVASPLKEKPPRRGTKAG